MVVVGSEHMTALMQPRGVIIVGATDRENSVGSGILKNIICAKWPEATRDGSKQLEEVGRSGSPQPPSKRGRKSCASDDDHHQDGRSKDWPELPYRVFPVNPKRKEILGFKCFPRPEDIIDSSHSCDLAVICVPAKSCLAAIESCGKLGTVRALIVIAAGFKEIGHEGELLERECIEMAEKYNMGVTGPNCLGVQSPNYHLNASFSAANALPGHIAFISQSGAICTAILDWSLSSAAAESSCCSAIGFSAFVSLGSMAHVEWADWISYCQADENTEAIIMYMETIGNASRFIEAAQRCQKPIVIIKAGKTNEAAAAAASHTGSLTGAYQNFLAAMDRAGCLVIDTIDELQIIIELLSSISKNKRRLSSIGDEVVVVTNAGGPGVLCTDAITEAKLKMLNPIPKECIEKLNEFLPHAWSHNNPIDILGDADHLCYKKTIQTINQIMTPPASSAGPRGLTLLIILTPQSVTRPTETALVIKEIVADQKEGDPFIICSWMGGPAIEEGKRILRRANIPVFDQPDVAARALGLLRKQQRLASGISELSLSPARKSVEKNSQARALLDELKSDHQTNRPTGSDHDHDHSDGNHSSTETITLSEYDSKRILKCYGLRVTDSVICSDEKSISSKIEEIGGYPVVLKIHGGKFSHKSDIGGVILNIKTKEEAEGAFKTIKLNYEKLDPSGFEGVTIQPMISSTTTKNGRENLTRHKNSPELIIGCVQDPQFGPMIMFGTGGTFVEIFNDTALALCPINSREQAEELVKKTAISKALMSQEGGKSSQRFPTVNRNDLYDTIISFSRLCIDLREDLLECEMNPLIITQDNNLLALDARIIIKTT